MGETTRRYGTVRQCSEQLSVSRQRIHQLMKTGRLGHCIREDTARGTVWYIPYPFKVAQGKTHNGRPKNE